MTAAIRDRLSDVPVSEHGSRLFMGSNPTGVRDFFSFFVWAHVFSRANAGKVSFGIFIRAL